MTTATRAISRASMPTARRVLLIIVAIAVVIGGGIVAAKVWADTTQEYDQKYWINSTSTAGHVSPKNPNEKCDTGKLVNGKPECTLRAALEAANATAEKDFIGLDEDWVNTWSQPTQTINLSTDSNTWMDTTRLDEKPLGGTDRNLLNDEDNGAVFTVTAPVMIDLAHKLSAQNSSDSLTAAVFFVNGQNITIQGVDNTYASASTYYVGPSADNVLITDGSTITPNFDAERHFVVRGGAKNITLSKHTVSGYYDDVNQGAWGMVTGTDATHKVTNLTITENTYYTDPANAGCGGSSASGCNVAALKMMGQWADNVTFSNNTSLNLNQNTSRNNARFVNITNSTVSGVTIANNTVRNAKVGSFRLFDMGGSVFTNRVSDKGEKTPGLTITGNIITNSQRTDASGVLFGLGVKTGTEDIVLNDNTVTNSTSAVGAGLVDLNTSASNAYTSFMMSGNIFTGITASNDYIDGVVRLPQAYDMGTTTISNNVFEAPTTSTGYNRMQAIFWAGRQSTGNNTVASGLTITNNVFDGFGYTNAATIRLNQSGTVTVSGNTFGTRTTAQTVTVREEGTSSSGDYYNPKMLHNYNTSANGKMNTWFPTAVGSSGSGSSAAEFQTADGTPNGTPTKVEAVGCKVDLQVAPPNDTSDKQDLTAARYPGTPSKLDVYWTAGNTAELYLGSFDAPKPDDPKAASDPKASQAGTLQIALPATMDDPRLETMKRPKVDDQGNRVLDADKNPVMVFADGSTDASAGTVLPVDPATGQVTGGLRVQTQDLSGPNAVPISSQYSRVAKIGGTCTPVLTVNRATADDTTGEKEQNRTTLARDIHFTVVSSSPIDAGTLEESDFLREGSTAPNITITSITPLPAGSTTVFDVVVRADDSGDIALSLPANAVTGLNGLMNAAASTSTDPIPIVTYQNPLRVAPTPLRLIAGEPKGQTYTISLDPLAPHPPTAPLTFTQTLDSTAQTYNLAVSPTDPSIGVGGTATAAITVTLPKVVDGQAIPPDTATTITHTLATTDQEYAGLRVPSVVADLYSTNPQISIDKAAYTCDETDPDYTNTYEYITGGKCHVIGSGASLKDAELVWFVFTVINTSPDNWPTTLSGITVTDDTLTDGTVINGKVEGGTCGPHLSTPCAIGTVPSLARGESAGLRWEHNPVTIHTTQEGGI